MHTPVTIQGRELTHVDIAFVRNLIEQHPTWSRRQLSIALSTVWEWRNDKGTLKDMACRSLLVKLHERDYIVLPARRQAATSRMTSRQICAVEHDAQPIQQPLRTVRPLNVIDVRLNRDYEPLYNHLLSRYHYLGYRSPVGENMKYLIVDGVGRPLACVLFGSSAWSCASRDEFIGWDSHSRRRNIRFTSNNTRFLILPWVKVPHLASHILGLISRRVSHDWNAHYGHGLCVLETFVDRERFAGTCYRAANWRHVGNTRGRGRNDRHTRHEVPVKAVFLYPLLPEYRSTLHQ